MNAERPGLDLAPLVAMPTPAGLALRNPLTRQYVVAPPSRTEIVMSSAAETAIDIRPFQVETPEEELTELRRRIEATRWPSKELVEDRSQGVQLATLQALARYWTTDYDWRKAEAKLNALPQFTTEIDWVVIHFIHVRSQHENALPLIMTHGWPGSVIELIDTVGPLTDPTAHGGTPVTHSTWCCRPCPVTGSPVSRPSSVGTPPAPDARGRS